MRRALSRVLSMASYARPFADLHITEHCIIIKVWRVIFFNYIDPPLIGIALHDVTGVMREARAIKHFVT